jgi:alpha-tubulin suppressor-like RCC1 family protein
VALLGATLLAAALLPTTAGAWRDRAMANMSATTTRVAWTPQFTRLAGTSIALGDDGSLAIWGYRGNGLSGTGVADVPAGDPITVIGLPGRRAAVKVAGTSPDASTMDDPDRIALAALAEDGNVYTWGGNQTNHLMGRSGDFTKPGQVSIPDPVADLVSTSAAFIALTETGDVYTWGYGNGHGETGQGSADGSEPTPKRILTGIHSIAAGMWNGWAIKQGTGYWWGWANAGALASDPSGDHAFYTAYAPGQSGFLTRRSASCAGVGFRMGEPGDPCPIKRLTGHTFGTQMLYANGEVYTWGSYYDFGIGRSQSGQDYPTEVSIPVPIVDIVPTSDYVMLLGADQTVYSFGRYSWAGGPDPSSGRLSYTNMSRDQVTRWSQLAGGVVALGANGFTGHALYDDNTIYSWGGGDESQTSGGAVRNNLYAAVRDGFATNSVATNQGAGRTGLAFPGSGAP